MKPLPKFIVEQIEPRPRHDRSIGGILVDAGKLTLEQAEQVLLLHRSDGMRFGESAVRLGFVSTADVEQALATQFAYPYLHPGESDVSAEVVAAYRPFSHQVEAIRKLRSQLMLRWFSSEPERKTLAVVSPYRNEGRSFIAANLAVVFSQLGEHTLLIDADLRNPCQHRLFGLDGNIGLSAILSGRGEPSAVQRVSALMDLSVLCAGPLPPNPQELLGRAMFIRLLDEFTREYDAIIIDTPAAQPYADAQTLALRSSGALLVMRKNYTQLKAASQTALAMADASITVVGTVLNEF